MIVKQSTGVSFLIGPILDADGVAKTDEVVASIKVTKNGSVGAPNGSSTLTHNHTGHYIYAANAGDVDTLGEVEFSLNSGTNAMAPMRFQVVPANVFDSLVSGSDLLDANASQLGGTSQTGRDVGASVLLSTGSGAGQLDFTSGVVKSNLTQILGTLLTETVGYIAAGVKKFFNVATPALTVESVNQTIDNPTAAAIGTDAASKVLATPAQLLVTDANGHVTYSNAAPPTADAIGTDAAAKILVTPAQKLKTDASGEVTAENMVGTDGANTVVPYANGAAVVTDAASRTASKATGFSTHDAAAVKTAVEAAGSHLTVIKGQTDKLNFTGDDVKATLDGEEVVTDTASRTASKATGFSTLTAAQVWAYGTRTLTSLGSTSIAAIWNRLTSLLTTSSSIGKLIVDNLDAQVSSVSGAVPNATTITEETLDVDGAVFGLVESDGVAIPGATVCVYADADEDLETILYHGTTDGDGGFSIQVAVGATYRVKAVYSGYTFDTKRVTV